MTTEHPPKFEGQPQVMLGGGQVDSRAAGYIIRWAVAYGLTYASAQSIKAELNQELDGFDRFLVRIANENLPDDGEAIMLSDGSKLVRMFDPNHISSSPLLFRLTGDVTHNDLVYVDYRYIPPVAATKLPVHDNLCPRIPSLAYRRAARRKPGINPYPVARRGNHDIET